MQSKKWVIWCVFVGIVGGAFLMVSPVGLLAAGIGANGQMFGSILILILSTYLTIFCVALKSKLYYKGDDRVSKFVTNTFLIAGTIGYAPIFIWFIGYIPFLNDLLYWLFSTVFSGQDAFSLFFLVVEFVAILSIISGIGYAISLKNFRE
ncbi:hypothetical protein GOM46_03700 [Streptococcus infantis]|jgi:hypothetical protein|uniref:Conserved domain protein n=1 Tax=Streptococcus infantis SK1076 TaxID=1005705 RepID=F5W0G3_9STRE|nr:hypothetical protein [Streptococcus infantis]EGL86444.1 conserved domain protein [Streptococcus infantis SK1076]UJD03715.1 hypothetical protein GOM46_03700 [Streptococcus infantis]